jgi:hypothetical protein
MFPCPQLSKKTSQIINKGDENNIMFFSKRIVRLQYLTSIVKKLSYNVITFESFSQLEWMLWCTNHPTLLFWLLIWFWNQYMAPQTWPHKFPISPQNVKSTNCFESSLYLNPYLKSLWSLYNGKTFNVKIS